MQDDPVGYLVGATHPDGGQPGKNPISRTTTKEILCNPFHTSEQGSICHRSVVILKDEVLLYCTQKYDGGGDSEVGVVERAPAPNK